MGVAKQISTLLCYVVEEGRKSLQLATSCYHCEDIMTVTGGLVLNINKKKRS